MGSTKKTVAKAPAAKKSTAKPAAKTVTKRIREEAPEENQPSAPTPAAPTKITNRLVDMAIEAGLPELDEDGNDVYRALWENYVRFIRQSPEKWELEKDALLEKLEFAHVKGFEKFTQAAQ